MRKNILILFLSSAGLIVAQQPGSNKFSLSTDIETYYLYDLNDPASKKLPGFLYTHTRHNQVSINYALIDLHYTDTTKHANFGLIAGDYSERSYAAEPVTYRHLYEANVGFQVMNGLWIEAGVLSSHIGLETVITQDNMTLSHSLMAHNTPFYETGVKASYTSDKWLFAFLVLNGWQNINDNNNNKAIGTQIQWKPADDILLNSSTFIGDGTNLPDSLSVTRYFHDFYFTYALTGKFTLAAEYDIGIQQKTPDASDYYTWWGTSVIMKYRATGRFSVAVRGEYFIDKNQVIIVTKTPNGFQAAGYSVNLDYSLSSNILLRFEGKHFSSINNLFPKENSLADRTSMLIGSIAFKF